MVVYCLQRIQVSVSGHTVYYRSLKCIKYLNTKDLPSEAKRLFIFEILALFTITCATQPQTPCYVQYVQHLL